MGKTSAERQDASADVDNAAEIAPQMLEEVKSYLLGGDCDMDFAKALHEAIRPYALLSPSISGCVRSLNWRVEGWRFDKVPDLDELVRLLSTFTMAEPITRSIHLLSSVLPSALSDPTGPWLEELTTGLRSEGQNNKCFAKALQEVAIYSISFGRRPPISSLFLSVAILGLFKQMHLRLWRATVAPCICYPRHPHLLPRRPASLVVILPTLGCEVFVYIALFVKECDCASLGHGVARRLYTGCVFWGNIDLLPNLIHPGRFQ